MDTITRRSAVIATAIHAAVFLAVVGPPWRWSRVPSSPTPPVARVVPPAPRMAPIQQHGGPRPRVGAHARIIMVVPGPGVLASQGTGPLPSVKGLPPLPAGVIPITPGPTGLRPGPERHGRVEGGRSKLDLPQSHDDGGLAQRLAQQASAPVLDHGADMRRTAADHLETTLRRYLDQKWPGWRSRIRRRALLITVVVDRTGRIIQAHVLDSLGDEDADHAIAAWLRSPDLILPPITPGIVHYFSIPLM